MCGNMWILLTVCLYPERMCMWFYTVCPIHHEYTSTVESMCVYVHFCSISWLKHLSSKQEILGLNLSVPTWTTTNCDLPEGSTCHGLPPLLALWMAPPSQQFSHQQRCLNHPNIKVNCSFTVRKEQKCFSMLEKGEQRLLCRYLFSFWNVKKKVKCYYQVSPFQ